MQSTQHVTKNKDKRQRLLMVASSQLGQSIRLCRCKASQGQFVNYEQIVHVIIEMFTKCNNVVYSLCINQKPTELFSKNIKKPYCYTKRINLIIIKKCS